MAKQSDVVFFLFMADFINVNDAVYSFFLQNDPVLFAFSSSYSDVASTLL